MQEAETDRLAPIERRFKNARVRDPDDLIVVIDRSPVGGEGCLCWLAQVNQPLLFRPEEDMLRGIDQAARSRDVAEIIDPVGHARVAMVKEADRAFRALFGVPDGQKRSQRRGRIGSPGMLAAERMFLFRTAF